MGSIRNEAERSELLRRLNRLTGNEVPLWGKMTCDQMLSHLVQGAELPLEASVPERSTFMSRNLIKYLVLHVLPIPKEVKVSAEMNQQEKGRPPQGFTADREILAELLTRVGTLSDDHRCLNHPMFGKMNARQWGLIIHKHTDHHLKQFGV
jgi:hypothetical protein